MKTSTLHPIFTIGHGRHPIETFVGLLKLHQVEFVCDVRSVARSRWPQFNAVALGLLLRESGIGYEHLPECGGKVQAPPEEFARGIERIVELAAETRVALMCSESMPLTSHKTARANCHRIGLLSPPLRRRGAEIIHILPDGSTRLIDETKVPSIW